MLGIFWDLYRDENSRRLEEAEAQKQIYYIRQHEAMEAQKFRHIENDSEIIDAEVVEDTKLIENKKRKGIK